ncbi:MAG: iron donor protein CyaY [Polyangiaceae bacterium]|jgi:CyaY protein
MNESSFLQRADEAFRSLEDACDSLEPEVVDCERAGDVVTLTLLGTRKCIVNTQRPTRQIWLAANARAWHFSWDEARGEWLDDRGAGEELFATVARVVLETTGQDVRFGR